MQNKSRFGFKRLKPDWLLILLVLMLCIFCGTGCFDEGPYRTIDNLGVVECIDQADTDTIACRGIPYAQPPVGDLRWKPPVRVKPWDGVLDATQWPNRAPQAEDGIGLGDISEDCLYLNITAPAEADEPLPVMVFLHGGGLSVHTGNSPVYNNTALPRQGVVMVTVNMRLGAMGYIAHPALAGESRHGAAGNYGTLDMIRALKWVRKHIHAFGGDKNKVTIFGESGGGTKVISLLTSPLASGLFHRAIVESGSSSVAGLRPTGDLETNYAMGVALQEALGIEGDPSDPATLAAMREKSMEDIVAAQDAIGYPGTLTVDGWVLADDVSSIFQSGAQNNVPLMCGAQTRDLGFDLTVGVTTLANLMSAIQQDTYVYVFSHLPANWRDQEKCGAFHGLELPYVFGLIPEGLSATIISYFATPSYCFFEPGYDESDVMVADYCVKMWAQFAKTGNPNYQDIGDYIENGEQWPAYAAGEGNDFYLDIADPMQAGTNPASAALPQPVQEPVVYTDDTYGFTITHFDNMFPPEEGVAAPVVWAVQTPAVMSGNLPRVQAIVLPLVQGQSLIDAFADYLGPAQTIETVEASAENVEINGVVYDSATVVSNLSMRSEFIGTTINDGADWIIFEKTQHINFGMPQGILDTVEWQ